MGLSRPREASFPKSMRHGSRNRPFGRHQRLAGDRPDAAWQVVPLASAAPVSTSQHLRDIRPVSDCGGRLCRERPAAPSWLLGRALRLACDETRRCARSPTHQKPFRDCCSRHGATSFGFGGVCTVSSMSEAAPPSVTSHASWVICFGLPGQHRTDLSVSLSLSLSLSLSRPIVSGAREAEGRQGGRR
ncbi:hypothetical protein LZ30DRAFT_362282 [Colletotrichum cereale]|nr:hypothetical protein LZ30DRAFT_362282 [Colletotrichum cereale]